MQALSAYQKHSKVFGPFFKKGLLLYSGAKKRWERRAISPNDFNH